MSNENNAAPRLERMEGRSVDTQQSGDPLPDLQRLESMIAAFHGMEGPSSEKCRQLRDIMRCARDSARLSQADKERYMMFYLDHVIHEINAESTVQVTRAVASVHHELYNLPGEDKAMFVLYMIDKHYAFFRSRLALDPTQNHTAVELGCRDDTVEALMTLGTWGSRFGRASQFFESRVMSRLQRENGRFPQNGNEASMDATCAWDFVHIGLQIPGRHPDLVRLTLHS